MRNGWAAALTALLAVPALAGCGEDEGEPKDRFAEIPKRTIEAPADQTAPRYERIATAGGRGPARKTIEVSPKAIQWRVRWRCRSGRFAVEVTPRPRAGPGRAEGRCPGGDTAVWTGTGEKQLRVKASGRWRLVVEEEVRTPLHEPPLAAMRPSRRLASGDIRRIEVRGEGTAALYRLPRKRLALRIEDFRTEPNPSLVVWLSEAPRLRTSKEVFRAPHTKIGALKSTIGDQNYLLPRGFAARKARSLVIVNEPSRIAYAGATLAR